jgi:serine/threonine-protein kinase
VDPTGQLLDGRYALDELIATGGMGQVWRARDNRLNRDVAVKVLRSEYTTDPTFLARFRAESQHSAGLLHPHIATLFDYGEATTPTGQHLAYLVMELVRGESLSTLLHREHRLTPDRTLEILRQCAAGLAAAHAAGVVHRDVKPGNVLLGADGSVKLTDFGVAVSAASVPLTRTGEVIGTANYLSPEQAQGHKATPASDVYALGLVGYECLAGQRGFDGESSVQIALRQIRELPPPLPDDVPEPVRGLIDRAIVKDPALRFADGAAFHAAVDDVLAHRPVGTPAPPRPNRSSPSPSSPSPSSPTPPPPFPSTQVLAVPDDDLAGLGPLEDDLEPERRRRWPLLLAALLTLLVVGGGTTGFLLLAGNRPDATDAAPATTSSSAPPTVALVSLTLSDYVGRPVGEVQAELTARDLQVRLQPQETDAAAVDAVLAVSPVGQLQPRAVVTVSYAVAPPPPSPTPTPTPTATPTPEPAPAPAPTTAPDDGGDDPAPPTTREEWEEWIEDQVGDWRTWTGPPPGNGNGNGRGDGPGNGRGND